VTHQHALVGTERLVEVPRRHDRGDTEYAEHDRS
jgi:hypothetical protein